MRISEIRKAGEVLGREELAKRVLQIAQEIIDNGSYKRAIRGAGQLAVIAKACTYDEYWNEKMLDGEKSEEYEISNKASAKSAYA